ncbi:MAG: tRNA lysidine(34) synthetase TilS [Pseudomonadota bacterium]|jgi:tRNA(Ile)-lysidine synthase
MPDLAALLDAALGRPLDGGERLAIAVSGGPDSVALLLLAQATYTGRLLALTVDHGLRPAAALEAAEVAALCAARGVSHATLSWVGTKPVANVQAEARRARYALMRDACVAASIGVLVTAHHADDQAETLLMRLARGSGAGLAGIRVQRSLGAGVTLLRPLLGTRRSVLAAIVADAGIVPVVDPSNDDPHYDRTHARRLLATTGWIDAAQLAGSAAHLAETEMALDWVTERAWAGRASVDNAGLSLDAAGLPVALVRRLVVRAIHHFVPDAVARGADITRLIGRLDSGGAATLAGVKACGSTPWRFTRAPPRRQIG